MHEELNIGEQCELGLDVLRQYPEVETDWDGNEHKPSALDQGNLGEALFAAEVAKRYWKYWTPGGDGYKGDIIIGTPDEKALLRVQVKKGLFHPTSGGFYIRWMAGLDKKKRYDLDAFDLMAAWIKQGDQVTWIYSTLSEPVTFWHPNPTYRPKGRRPEANNWHLAEEIAHTKHTQSRANQAGSELKG